MYNYVIWKNARIVKGYKSYTRAAKAYNAMLDEDANHDHDISLDSKDGSVFLENGEKAIIK